MRPQDTARLPSGQSKSAQAAWTLMLDSDLQHSVFGAINGEPDVNLWWPRPSEVGMAVVIMAGPFYSIFPGVMLDADTQSMATKRSQDENSYLC